MVANSDYNSRRFHQTTENSTGEFLTFGPIKTDLRGAVWLGVNPEDGKLSLEIVIPKRRIVLAHKRGIGAVHELAHHVTHVIARPTKLYEGIVRDDDEDAFSHSNGWLCYCGVPPGRYDFGSGDLIKIESRVLLVFVNLDREVYTYRWEAESRYQAGVPADSEGRFVSEKI